MHKSKIDAVYELREAAEAHGRAETVLQLGSSPQNRDAALQTRVELEAKTAQALEACEYCGRLHRDDEPHPAASAHHTAQGVIELRFDKPAADIDAEDPPA